MTVQDFAQKSSLLAQFVNGMYLGEFAKTATPMQLAEEFFSLGSVKLSSLDSSEMNKLETNLESILKAIDDCGGNGCGVSSDVLEEMKKVVSYDSYVSDFNTALASSQKEEFTELTALLNHIATIETAIGMESIQTIKNRLSEINVANGINDADVDAIKTALGEANNLMSLFKQADSLIDAAETNFGKAKTDMEAIEKLANKKQSWVDINLQSIH
uniref:WSN domain-containing protein n=1 Tax=Caenorhabditis tropicalis TaxID=1561998 RepID=A0A1I7THB9_9PELO